VAELLQLGQVQGRLVRCEHNQKKRIHWRTASFHKKNTHNQQIENDSNMKIAVPTFVGFLAFVVPSSQAGMPGISPFRSSAAFRGSSVGDGEEDLKPESHQRWLNYLDNLSGDDLIDPNDVIFLASDELGGRVPTTEGSRGAQEYLIDQLEPIAAGFGTNGTRDDYRQSFPCFDDQECVNIIGVIEGSEIPDEYVIVGSHYDHVEPGVLCRSVEVAESPVCNGAADNAAGMAVALGIARTIASLPVPPRRSVVFAFWDMEEYGLEGSRYYTQNPIFSLSSTVAYLNFETMGVNLLPSLRGFSFAIGSETGGPELRESLDRAIMDEGLNMRPLSLSLGLSRSDHSSFADVNVPLVFFSDATGGCYHTNGDEVGVVDFGKLEKEGQIGLKLTLDLAATTTPPTGFTASSGATLEDAFTLFSGMMASLSDFDLVGPVVVGALWDLFISIIVAVVTFDTSFDFVNVAFSAMVESFAANVECDGFLPE